MSDENKGFFVALTNAGAALQTNAWQGGDKINLTEFNIGSDASGVNVTQIDVLSPVGGRMKINNIKQKDDDAGVLEIECVLPPEVGGWQMSSIGLFTDTGILFAVANIPSDYKPVPSEGATKEVVITLYIALGSTETVNLNIDPYKVIATQDWVNNDSVPAKHMENFNNPHKVTAEQVGAPTTTAFNNHKNSKENPHGVTAEQVGAAEVRRVVWLDQTNGNDNNNGATASSPVKSVKRAVALGNNATSLIINCLSAVTFEEIVYGQAMNIELRAVDSNEAPVTRNFGSTGETLTDRWGITYWPSVSGNQGLHNIKLHNFKVWMPDKTKSGVFLPVFFSGGMLKIDFIDCEINGQGWGFIAAIGNLGAINLKRCVTKNMGPRGSESPWLKDVSGGQTVAGAFINGTGINRW